MRRVRIPPFRFPVKAPYRELKEGHNRVRQWKTPGRAPVPETDFFHQWEIPLEAYKGIGPGPRFIPVHNEPPFVSQHLYRYLDSPLPSHPQLESLPAPPESSATPAATLNRALVVKGILDEDLSHVLLKIHQGPLEFSRLDQEEQLLGFMPRTHALTLSFLSSNSAHAFVNAHLSEPARLYEFARSFDPTWEWLPATPLPPSVTHALQAHTARRALSIAWLAFADRYLGDVRDFGAVQYRWQYGPGRLVVHYYAIADAIRAHAELRTNPKLRVSFFPDWCELSAQGRDVLMEHGRLRKGLLSTHGAWMVNWNQHWGRLLNIVEHGPKRVKPPKNAETPSDPLSVPAEEFLKWYLTQVGIGLAGAPSATRFRGKRSARIPDFNPLATDGDGAKRVRRRRIVNYVGSNHVKLAIVGVRPEMDEPVLSETEEPRGRARKRKNKEGPPAKVVTKAAQEASPPANASAEGPAPTDALPLSTIGADSAIAEAETSSSPTTAAQDVSPPANVSAEGPAPTDPLPPSTIGTDSAIADAETSFDPSSVSAEEFLKWYLTQVGHGLAGVSLLMYQRGVRLAFNPLADEGLKRERHHVANNVGSNHIKLAIVGVRPEMDKAAAKGSAEGPPNVLPPSTIGADSTTAEAETSSDISSVSAEAFQKWYFTQVGIGLAGVSRLEYRRGIGLAFNLFAADDVKPTKHRAGNNHIKLAIVGVRPEAEKAAQDTSPPANVSSEKQSAKTVITGKSDAAAKDSSPANVNGERSVRGKGRPTAQGAKRRSRDERRRDAVRYDPAVVRLDSILGIHTPQNYSALRKMRSRLSARLGPGEASAGNDTPATKSRSADGNATTTSGG